MILKLNQIDEPAPEIFTYVESSINTKGYDLLYDIGDIAGALNVFNINVSVFPSSANAHDSYAEAWLVSGDTAQAITWYEKAIQLEPTFESAQTMLKKIQGK